MRVTVIVFMCLTTYKASDTRYSIFTKPIRTQSGTKEQHDVLVRKSRTASASIGAASASARVASAFTGTDLATGSEAAPGMASAAGSVLGPASASTRTDEARGPRASLASPGSSSDWNSEPASASTGVASGGTVGASAKGL